MKRLFLIPAFAALLFTACTSAEKKVENAAENVSEAQEDLDKAEQRFAEEWDKFQIESNEQMTSNEREILRYREMEGKDKNFKQKYNERIDDLDRRNTELRNRINSEEAKQKRKENWEEFKREFKHDMNELGAALKDLTKDNSN